MKAVREVVVVAGNAVIVGFTTHWLIKDKKMSHNRRNSKTDWRIKGFAR